MYEGIVKWYDYKKGYGFITTRDKDLFFHWSQIEPSIRTTIKFGDQVEFDIYETSPDKYEARNIKRK